MREILFRGKTKKGRWVEGWFCGATCDSPHGDAYQSSQIIEKNTLLWLDVIPETVGQYTGLTDKNGKKIFEGDIIKHFNDLDNPDSYDVGTVLWDDHRCRFFRTSEQTVKHIAIGNECNYEIIGNIHDNPELMGGNENESGTH